MFVFAKIKCIIVINIDKPVIAIVHQMCYDYFRCLDRDIMNNTGCCSLIIVMNCYKDVPFIIQYAYPYHLSG